MRHRGSHSKNPTPPRPNRHLMPADCLDTLIERVLCLHGSTLRERECCSDRAVDRDPDAALSLRQHRHTFQRGDCSDVSTSK
jgi:hypothetical protein